MPEPRPNTQPKIAANPNDVAGYRRSGAKARAEGNGTGFGTSALLIALLAGLGAAGWFIVMQHQQLTKAESDLSQADRRLAVLEERLQVTDQVMSQSGTEVQGKIGQWENEIRKLQDAAKRDHQMITDDQAKLKDYDGSIDTAQNAIKELKSSDLRHEQALAQQTAIAQQLATIDQQVKQVVAQQRQLSDQVNATKQAVAGLETGLAKRVSTNEKAIEAIDAYRSQLNSRLVELQTRIDAMQPTKTP